MRLGEVMHFFFNFTTPLNLDPDDKSNSTTTKALEVHVRYTNYIVRRLKIEVQPSFLKLVQMKLSDEKQNIKSNKCQGLKVEYNNLFYIRF